MMIAPGPRRGCAEAPSSKSQLHRLLILAALGERPVSLSFRGLSEDIRATARCLAALGARISFEGGASDLPEDGCIGNACAASGSFTARVSPIPRDGSARAFLPCGESGSTLRFLLPVCGALGRPALFAREGRLPERPIGPLAEALEEHGMNLHGSHLPDGGPQSALLQDGMLRSALQPDDGPRSALLCSGRLRGGRWSIAGGVSSQFVSGLLMALPLLDEDSELEVTGDIVSAPYIGMTERCLRLAGLSFSKDGCRYRIPGGQRPALPERISAEGDWSSAAFFLCCGAFSKDGVSVSGLDPDSAQGDRRISELLRGFGAEIETVRSHGGCAVRARKGAAFGKRAGRSADLTDASSGRSKDPADVPCDRHVAFADTPPDRLVDLTDAPDLAPALCAVAAASLGRTVISGAGRLRQKESDRLEACARMVRAFGASACVLPDGLEIEGRTWTKESGGDGPVIREFGSRADDPVAGEQDRRSPVKIETFSDHRIAMAAAVLACAGKRPVEADDADCAAKSYPGFWEDFMSLETEDGSEGEPDCGPAALPGTEEL